MVTNQEVSTKPIMREAEGEMQPPMFVIDWVLKSHLESLTH